MSKRYKLMSIVLLICICTSLLTPISTAYAKEKDIHLSEEIIDTQELSEAGNTNYGDLEEPDDMHNLEKQEGLQTQEHFQNSESVENLEERKREIIIPAEKLEERYNIKVQSPEREEYIENYQR